MFCITHSRQSVLYHSQLSVCSVSLTVISLFCFTHCRQSVLYHSLSSVCSVSLTVFSMFCITHCRQSVLYHSQSSVCSLSLTVVSLFCITHCHQYHSQSSQSLTVVPVTHSLILCSVNSLSIMHLTAHTIWPDAVYFCMAIITICARFRASYSV